ncbi:ABC transporter ATP-binding protein [Marinibaculum pumilum]|uniref:ABC transporter ATP-binding protein n=1 Tax=Marinibaculum pumilum TaxID=1766165 RepID=A0ABV7L327_9PROT
MGIDFRQVGFRYAAGQDGQAAGVADIDLAVDDGELLALIGPSGSGKSTLLKLLAGFFDPHAGQILVDGQDVAGLAPERRRLGMVFQNYALFPHMSVAQNTAYPLKVRGIGRAERLAAADAMLARVGLAGMGGRAPASLSGGQQQRVALARALVFEPRALLLDEPLSALDAGLRVAMRDEIRRVQREAGIATIHVTHDQEEALSIADRVAVLRDGRLEQVGPPQAIYDRPCSRFVAGFVGQANFIDGVLRDGGVVETPLGALRHAGIAAPGLVLADGAAVTVLVRPERVEPAATGATGHPNLLPGTLGEDRFLGAVRRYDFRVAGGLLRVESRHRDTPDAVAIPPEAIRLLPPAAEASTEGRPPT